MNDANKEIGYIFYFFILSYNQFRNLKLFKEEEVKLKITLSKKAIKS